MAVPRPAHCLPVRMPSLSRWRMVVSGVGGLKTSTQAQTRTCGWMWVPRASKQQSGWVGG